MLKVDFRVPGLLRHVLLGGALAAAAWSAAAEPQQSAFIELQSTDGTTSVSGNLIGVEDGIYILDVKGLGILRIDAAKVRCTGFVCPEALADGGPEFGIYGSRTVGTVLIPTLLEGYARHLGAAYEIADAEDGAGRRVTLTKADGTLLAKIDPRPRARARPFRRWASTRPRSAWPTGG